MIKLQRFHLAEEFLEAAGAHLYPQEIRNGLILGVVERLVGSPDFYGTPPYLALLLDGDFPLLAAAMTPPYWLLLNPLTENVSPALPMLVEDLVMDGWNLPAVHSIAPYSRQFADQWADRTGGKSALELANRLFALREVSSPVGVPGRMVQAEAQHSTLISEWMHGFDLDAFGETTQTAEDYQRNAEKRIAESHWHLWEVDGEIVSMAMINRPLRQSCTVSGVYTPPEHRRNGYAGACVAALSQKLLDAGFETITLFADLANQTANHIYMKIGYQPVANFDKYKLILPKETP